MIRVLVADDHPVVREGLKRIVDSYSDLTVVAEAADGKQVIAESEEGRADVILLDVSMPGPGFLETVRRLGERCPDTRILVLSVHSEESYAVRAFRAGAAGYLNKDRSPEELAAAIRRVHGGRKYVTQSLAEKLAHDLEAGASRPAHETLSDREFQIFCLLGEGKSVSDIASEVSLSPKTVSTYRARILAKMGLRNNAQIIRYAIEHELL